MRSTHDPSRGTWATFARRAREASLLTKTELARRLGVDRATIHRWETGQTRPEDADVIAAFARLLGLDLDEALAAAGLRPGYEPPAEPTREVDEEVDAILAAPVNDHRKKQMLERLFELREQDKRRRMDEIRFWLRRDTG